MQHAGLRVLVLSWWMLPRHSPQASARWPSISASPSWRRGRCDTWMRRHCRATSPASHQTTWTCCTARASGLGGPPSTTSPPACSWCCSPTCRRSSTRGPTSCRSAAPTSAWRARRLRHAATEPPTTCGASTARPSCRRRASCPRGTRCALTTWRRARRCGRTGASCCGRRCTGTRCATATGTTSPASPSPCTTWPATASAASCRRSATTSW